MRAHWNTAAHPGPAGHPTGPGDVEDSCHTYRPVLEEGEAGFLALAHHSPDCILRLDRDLRFVYVNPAVEIATGIPASAFLGHTGTDAGLEPGLVEVYEEALRRVFKFGGEESLEMDLVGPQGWRRFLCRFVPEPSLDGPPRFAICIGHDISERVRMEDNLRESEERFGRIVEMCPDAIAVQHEGQIILMNRAGLEILGATTPDQVIGRPALDFLHPESREEAVEHFEAVVLGQPSKFTVKLVRFDGHTILAEVITAPVPYQGLDATQVVFRDITAQHEAETALRREADMLTAIIRTQADVTAVDMDLQTMLALITERTGQITNAPAASVGILENGHIHYYFGNGLVEYHTGMRLPINGGITQLSLETGESIYCRDADTDSRVNRTACRDLGMRSLISTPLHRDGKSIGLLTVYAPEPHAFTELDIRTLELMAGFVAAALARASEAERRQAAVAALQESETRFRHVWETSADGMRLTDENGTVLMVNEAYCRIVGLPEEKILGKPFSAAYANPDNVQEVFMGRLKEGRIPERLDTNVTFASGRHAWLATSNSMISMAGQPPLLLSTFRDVTRSKEAEQALVRYEMLAQNANDIMLFCTLEGVIVEVNDAALRAYGYTRDELIGIHVSKLRDDVPEKIANDHRAAAQSPQVYATHHIRKDGSRFPVEVSLQCKKVGGEHLLFGVARDTTERTAFEQKLEHRAFHDPLTELPNRTLFLDRLGHALRMAQERNRRVGLLFLDVDRFKVVNDSLGHHAGDQVLLSLAGRLRSCIRGTDTAARFGGDEFTILLEDITSEGDATRTADRILRKLQAPFEVGGQEVYVTVSIGVTVSGNDTIDPDQFLRDADMAMYQAKLAGRARKTVYEGEMSHDTRARLQLETDLRRAIEREEFLVYYQPIVLMETGRTIGVEALVRWHHPQFGLMDPDAFIPLQEQIGLIEPFTMWVLQEAQRNCLDLQRRGLWVSVSVNLSVHNLHDPGFAHKVGALLCETGLSPASLKLEITESAVMMNPTRALDILSGLNAMGVRLSIDDFGTGYSSLSYLKQLPVQEIKIDKSFVLGMDTSDDDDAAIVRATIDLAHNLRKKVVAEGVESQGIYDLLHTLGCDAAQGYYMARPMPKDQLIQWLQHSPFGLPTRQA